MKKLKIRYVTATRHVTVTNKVAHSANERGNIYRVIERRKDIEMVHMAVFDGKEAGDEA